MVVGTRPELIKMAPVLRLMGDDAILIHTGQHYDDRLAGQFFRELGITPPNHSLDVGGRSRACQIGSGVERLEDVLIRLAPAAVVVHGDTNAAVTGALAANALRIPLAHVESGLRSFDRRMPEEHNRVVVDHLADLCLAPTEVNRANLAAEGISGDRVVVTGNTIVEAVLGFLPPPEERAGVLEVNELEPDSFVLATIHRPENVDDPLRLRSILEALSQSPVPVALPAHPRTVRAIERYHLEAAAAGIRVTNPLGYRDFLALAAHASVLVSDSGGVQEEASILKRQAIVVRRSTERPEVLGTFTRLVEPGPSLGPAIREAVARAPYLNSRLADLPSPYGDGRAAFATVAAIRSLDGGATVDLRQPEPVRIA